MRKLHDDGSEALRLRIPKNYAAALKRLAVGGKTVSSVVREALNRYFGVAETEPPKQESGGMMFPKAKWAAGKRGGK